MNPGLPGAGIGGLFYILAALCAPGLAVLRARRPDPPPRRWALALRLLGMAIAIAGAMWLTAWAIGAVLMLPPGVDGQRAAAAGTALTATVGRSLALLTLTTLAGVLVAVELLRLLLPIVERRRSRRITSPTAGRIAPADESPLRAMGGEQ